MLVRLDRSTDRAYRRAVASLGRWAEPRLEPGVIANRADLRAPARVRPWRPARVRWDRLTSAPGWWLRADVRDCYASIDDAVLRRALGHRGEAVVEALRVSWDAGVRGLPVGPESSALVANWVLGSVDEAIREAGAIPLRWVDDWSVPVAGPPAADAARRSLERALGQLGLSTHAGKTGVLVVDRRGQGRAGSAPTVPVA